MVLGLGVFLFLEFFLSVMIPASDGWFLIFFLLFALDLGAFFWMYKVALGRELLLDGLKRITDGELSYKIPEEIFAVIRKKWPDISIVSAKVSMQPWKKASKMSV